MKASNKLVMSTLVENLKRLMEQRGISASALSSRAGKSRTVVGKIIDGSAKNPRSDTLTAIAKVLETTVGELTGEDGMVAVRSSATPVRWVAAAGIWREADYPDTDETVEFEIPTITRDGRPRYLCHVRGDSMNRVNINDGDYLVCLAFEDTDCVMRTGQIVVVERTKGGGDIETTVKVLRCAPDHYELVPMSKNPRHKIIIVPNNDTPDDGIEVRIVGVVESRFTPLPGLVDLDHA